MDAKALLPYFFVGWAALGTSGWWWVSSRKIPAQKRRALRVMAITASVVFGAFIGLSAKPSMGLLVIGGVLIFITYVNIKLVKVCDSCAAISRPQGLTPLAHCYKCGAKLIP
jgi:hypothetical protein